MTDDVLDVVNRFRTISRQHHRAIVRDEHVVFNPNPDVGVALGTIDIWSPSTKVKAGFDGEAHAWLKDTRGATGFVHTCIVDVKADPVAGVVHVPFSQVARLGVQRLVQRLGDDTEANQAFSKDGTSSIMRVGVEIPHLTGINGGQLGIQHDLIDFALESVKRPEIGQERVMSLA